MTSLAELKARFDYPARAGRVDWHCHSNASDGLDAPAQLVRLARKAGLEEIALTDHDSISGITEAQKAGRRLGVRVVPGVEFNTLDRFSGTNPRPHILGLAINPRAPLLRAWLARLARHRENRSRAAVAKLQSIGYRITFKDVRRHAKGVLSRPAVARALVERAENRALLKRTFHLKGTPNVTHVFDHLIYRGGPGYARSEHEFVLTPNEAFRLIRSAGGLPIVAHPLICEIDNGFVPLPFARLRDYTRAGCGGVEVYYNNYVAPKQNTHAVRERWARECRKLGLAVTGGGDHHGYGKLALVGHSLGQIPYP